MSRARREPGRGGPARRSVLELEPGLRCLPADNPGPLTLDGTRTYLVGRRRLVVIDPGPDLPGRVERLVAAIGAAAVEAVALTHAHLDHAGCAIEAAAALATPLRAGRRSLDRLGVAGDPLADGDELPVDGGVSRLRALATPGHSGDHTCYVWLPGRRLFTGDLVLGEGSSLVAHPDGSVGDYLNSLDRLAAARPTRLLPGHGPPVEDAPERIDRYRRHRLERERQVLEAIRGGAVTPGEVQRRVYGELPDTLARAARLSILAHLRHLWETGRELPPSLAETLQEADHPSLER